MRRGHTKYMLLTVENETYCIISVLPECTRFPTPYFILPYCSMYTALSDQSVWCQSDNCQPWLGRSQDQKASFFFFLLNENFLCSYTKPASTAAASSSLWCQLTSFFWRHQSFTSNLLSQRMLSLKHFLKCFHMIQHFTIFPSYILKKCLGFP